MLVKLNVTIEVNSDSRVTAEDVRQWVESKLGGDYISNVKSVSLVEVKYTYQEVESTPSNAQFTEEQLAKIREHNDKIREMMAKKAEEVE
jgi:methionyl-tRNA synthetase